MQFPHFQFRLQMNESFISSLPRKEIGLLLVFNLHEGEAYQVECIHRPIGLSTLGLLPRQRIIEIISKDYSKEGAQAVKKELQSLSSQIKKIPSLAANREQLHCHLGTCLLLLERYDEAVQEIGKAWKLNKENPDYCIQMAICLMESSNYFEAIKLLQSQLRRNEGNENLLHHLAVANLNVENYREAIFNFYKGYQIGRQLEKEFIERGEGLLRERRYVEAVPFFIKRVVYEPLNEECINGLKDCFVYEGQLEKAAQVYECFGQIEEFKTLKEHSLALLYFQAGDIEKALPHLTIAVVQKPKNYQLNLYIATAYFKEGRFQEAIAHYLRCLQSNPSDHTVLSSLGMVYMKLNQVQKAEQFYLKSIEISQQQSMSWYGYALVLFQRNKVEEGIKCLEKAVQLDEFNYPALEKLGSALILLGQEQKGANMLERAQDIRKKIIED